MANPKPIFQVAPRTKTHVEARTDSSWWLLFRCRATRGTVEYDYFYNPAVPGQ
jgi:hypothetical protein